MDFLLLAWLTLLLFVTAIFSSFTILCFFVSRKKIEAKKFFFPSIELVVPFRNEAKILKEKAANLSKLKYPKKKLSIIFLNDYSTDDSVKIIKKESPKIRFNTKIVPNRGKQGLYFAVTYIFSKLKSDIVVINDADVPLHPDSLRHLAEPFSDPSVGMVTGRLVPVALDRQSASFAIEKSYRGFFDLWRRGESRLGSITVANGAINALRSGIAKKIQIKINMAGDTSLIFLLQKLGYRAVYAENAVAFEVIPAAGNCFKAKFRRARGINQNLTGNLILLGKGGFGLIAYPYALLLNIFSPWLVMLGIAMYPFLLPNYPFLLALLFPLALRRPRGIMLSFLSLQAVSAAAFFYNLFFTHLDTWEPSKSSRDETKQFLSLKGDLALE